MKLIIIAVVAVLLLGGGGGAAWWFLLREPPEEEVVEVEPERPEKIFYDMDPMVVGVIRDGQAIRHLTFMIIVQVEDLEKRGRVVRRLAEIRDAFRLELHALYSSRIIQEREGVMPVLSKRLRTAANKIVGPEVVQRVLVNIMTEREFETS